MFYQGSCLVLILQLFLTWHYRHLSEPGWLSSSATLFGWHSLCGFYWVTDPLLPVPVCAIPGLCVTPKNYTPWIVRALPSSSVSKHPNLNVLLHSNPSSATWSVHSEEEEIFGLWKTMPFCFYRRKAVKKLSGVDHGALSFACKSHIK